MFTTVLAQESGIAEALVRMAQAFARPDVFVFMIPIVTMVAMFWHASIKVRSNNDLKRSMLDRGMSAEEIERVINAGDGKSKKK